MKKYRKNYVYDIGGIVNPAINYGMMGAKIGGNFGPLGMGIGAGVGILGGLTQGIIEDQKNKKIQADYEKTVREEQYNQQGMRFNNLNSFSTPYYRDGGEVYGLGGYYDNGGTIKQGDPTKLIVTDPNDPRLRAYNDSLSLYNSYPRKKQEATRDGYEYIWYENDFNFALDMVGGKEAEEMRRAKIKPFMFEHIAKFYDDGRSEENMYIPIYKKPTREVVLGNSSTTTSSTSPGSRTIYSPPPLPRKRTYLEDTLPTKLPTPSSGDTKVHTSIPNVEVQVTRDFQKVKGRDKDGKPYVAGYKQPRTGKFILMNNDEYQDYLKRGNKVKAFANGGMSYGNAEIEDNEVIETNGIPMYSDGGKLYSLSDNGYVADGNTHSEGGIDTMLPEGSKIYSDRLFNSKGTTFAKEAKYIQKMKGKVEKNTSNDTIKKNTLSLIDKRMDKLFSEQESQKTPQGNTYAYGGEFDPVDPRLGFPEYTKSNSIYSGGELPEVGIEGISNPGTGFNYGSLLPYLSPVVQGISALGKKQYMPQRRVSESTLSGLPSDIDAENMTRSAASRGREGLRTVLSSLDRSTGTPARNSNKSSVFAEYLKGVGDINSTEAQLKAGFKTNRTNSLLNLRAGNLNQARLEDENRLMTDANSRNIQRESVRDVSKIAQYQNQENSMRDRDILALSAVLANAEPSVRQNYLKNLRIPKSYQYLFNE